jgi:hypothetical protein
MGLDIRDVPRAAVDDLPDLLRSAGFEVVVGRKPHGLPGVVTSVVSCRRGEDVQNLIWHEEPSELSACRVYIPNAWGWRASTRRRRQRLQIDVTTVIEQAGGR